MDRLAFLTAERSGGFAAIRGRIQAFLRDIGAENVVIEALPETKDHGLLAEQHVF